MKKLCLFISLLLSSNFLSAQTKNIYHNGWIDFNKNGKKDVYEDPKQSTDKRANDLLRQMNVNEKTCQLATLYGYGAVLKDHLPAPGWKDSIWKDGIANIDEQLTGLRKDTLYAYPYSSHAGAINTIQKFFVEETRLGIPVDFTTEGIRGLNHMKATYFPAQIAQACSFDTTLVRQIGDVWASSKFWEFNIIMWFLRANILPCIAFQLVGEMVKQEQTRRYRRVKWKKYTCMRLRLHFRKRMQWTRWLLIMIIMVYQLLAVIIFSQIF